MTADASATDDENAALLRFTNVQKKFGDSFAVRDFNLEIGRGDFVAIMGPSGCGKTTTLRMLAGLEHPTAGEIRRNGEMINGLSPWLRRMPLVWQNYALFPFLTVLENVEFGLRNDKVSKIDRRRRASEWLDRLGIGDLGHRSPTTLSGGQAQRVALARALVLEPEVLLLDEPLSALDANMVVRMQTEIAQLQKALGITFVYVTHNQSEAFAMANRVVIMNQGKIEQVGEPLEVYRLPKTRFVAEFVGTNNIIDGTIVSHSPSGVVVETKLGQFVSTNPIDGTLGEASRVHIIASADLVSVSQDRPKDSKNVVTARLIGESFAGTIVILVFEAAGGQELKVQLQQRALQDLSLDPNQEFHLVFEPMDTLVIPSV